MTTLRRPATGWKVMKCLASGDTAAVSTSGKAAKSSKLTARAGEKKRGQDQTRDDKEAYPTAHDFDPAKH